jgi:hypothetical protein
VIASNKYFSGVIINTIKPMEKIDERRRTAKYLIRLPGTTTEEVAEQFPEFDVHALYHEVIVELLRDIRKYGCQ